jgi:Flp pilus assembly protein TadG
MTPKKEAGQALCAAAMVVLRRPAVPPGVRVEAQARGKQRRARDMEGEALVEFAFVLPLLLALVLGLIAFGITLNAYLTLTNATNLSAQLLSISRGQTTDPCNTTVQAFYTAAPNLVQKNLKFTILLDGNNVGGTSCSGAAGDLVEGTTAQVTVTYPCNLNLFGFTFTPSCTLTAETAEDIQ